MPRSCRFSRTVGYVCSLAALGTGVLVLLGWAFGVEALRAPIDTAASMKPNTAVACILLAFAVLPRSGRVAGWAAVAGAALTILVAGANLVQDLAGVDLGIDQLLFESDSRFGPPGRMAMLSAFLFVALGGAVLLMRSGRRELSHVAGILALGCASITGMVLLAHIVWTMHGSSVPLFSRLSPLGAGVQFLLAAGIAVQAAASLPYGGMSRLSRTIVASAVLVSALSVAVWGTINWKDYAGTVEEARVASANLTRVMEEHARRSLDPATLTLRRLAEQVREEGVDSVLYSRAAWERIRTAAEEFPQVSSFGILDPSGELRLLTTAFPAPKGNYAHRDYFKAHAAGAEHHLGPLVVAGTSGKLIFTLSRRISDDEGRFAGVVFASMDAAYFVTFYESLNLGPGAAVALFRSDGRLLVRQPMAKGLIDLDLSGNPMFRDYIHRDPVRTFKGRSPIDRDDKIISYRYAQDLGLVTNATVPLKSVVAGFERRFLASSAVLLAVLSTLGVSVLMQLRALRREEEARAAQAKSQAMADTVLNSMSAHVAILDERGTIIDTNEAWRRFARESGLAGDPSCIGVNYLEICRRDVGGDADLARAIACGISAVIEGKRPEFIADYPCHSPGIPRWFNLRATPLSSGDGRVVISHENITDLKLSEQRMREARDEAERASRAKAEFLATMSHEIRTPMNGVIGFVDMLLDTKLSDEQRRYAANVRAAGRSLLTVINDILDFSKLEAGRLDLRSVPFNLGATASTCEAIVRPVAAGKGLDLRTVIAADVAGYVLGDPDRVQQILLNLLSNAVKFTDRGSVVLTVTRSGGEGGVPVFTFSVSDTGIGIPEERQAALFQRFNQIERGRGGTGLGLAICRYLVELMTGTIGVRSRPGEGSTFWFALPLKPVEVCAVAPSAQRAEDGVRQRRLDILVAEDVAMNRELMVRLLTRAGHAVHAVEDGAEALRAVQEKTYDLVLMDVHMPVMGGLEATRAIRALPGPAGRVPIMAMTAGAMAEEVRDCLKAGMDEHLAKPVDRDALFAAIERHTAAKAEPVS